MSTLTRPRKKTTYVVSKQVSAWLLNEQRKLYARAFENTDFVFRKLWGLLTDLHRLILKPSQLDATPLVACLLHGLVLDGPAWHSFSESRGRY